MSRLYRFIHLPIVEKWFFFQALYYLALYRLYLRISPLHGLVVGVSRKSRTLLSPFPSEIPVKRIARLLTVASSCVPLSTCLSQALAGQILFARHGRKTSLHLGVCNSADAGFEAHAWLCLDGAIVLGYLPDMNRYRELPFIPVEDGI